MTLERPRRAARAHARARPLAGSAPSLASRRSYFSDNWNCFDMFIIVCAIVDSALDLDHQARGCLCRHLTCSRTCSRARRVLRTARETEC